VVEEVLGELPQYSLGDAGAELQTLMREGELILREWQRLVDGKYLRVLPGHFETDGFFAAVIQQAAP
jgi:16S rRNA C967 or C1407 C5-methylase (RsmB/RsmF family)